MAAGSVIIDLLFKTGTFETDIARASKSLNKLQKDAEASGKSIGLAFSGALLGLGYLVKRSIDAEDHLGDLSKKTGVAAETLGGIGFAASQAGSSLDAVVLGVGKLNKTLAEAAGGNQEAAAALKALGVDAIDPLTGKTTAVDVALVKLAGTFEKSVNSPEKFRAAAQALGKQYQELVPLLDDGAKSLLKNIEYYKRYSGVTEETVTQSDEFNDTLGKIGLLSSAFGKILAAELLPSLQALANLWLENKENGNQFRGVAEDIAAVFKGAALAAVSLATGIATVGRAIGAYDAVVSQLREGNFKGALNIGQEFGSDVEKSTTQVKKFFDALYNPPAAKIEAKPRSLNINSLGSGTSSTAEAEALLKKHLDGLLRSIKNATDEQQSALAFAGRFLEGEYHDSLISLQNFFDDQSSIRKRALQVKLDQQDKIIAAEEEFARKTKNPASRVEAQDKADEARRTKTRLIVQSQQEEQLALQQNARDVLELKKAFEGVNAQVLDLHENFAAAAAIKFDLQFDALSKTFTANGNAAGLEAINTLRAAAIAQAAFQKASLDSSRTLEDLALIEERIAIAEQIGAITSLEGLAKTGEARRVQIALLERQLVVQQTLAGDAKLSGAANADQLIRQAAQGQVALDKLKASADPLAESLNKTFSNDLNSALDDFVTGTKSAADAFKSFTKSVLNDILKLGSKSIAESLIGGSGGAGGFLSGLFSSGSAQGGTSAAGGFLSSIASLFSGFFAEGGTIAPGKFGVVGERGPELAFGGISGQTINPGNRSTVQNISVNVNAQRGMDKGTALQQGRDIGAGIRQALARND